MEVTASDELARHIRVFLNEEEVTIKCTRAILPSLPDVYAVGFVELIKLDEAGLVIVKDEAPVTEIREGEVMWKRRSD